MIRFLPLNSSAKIPAKASLGSAGYDIFSSEEMIILPGQRRLVDTGFSMAFEENMYARIAPRSGLAVKGIDVGAGVIDSDYRGPVKVLLINNSQTDFKVNVGDRIAQMVFESLAKNTHFQMVESLSDTERGAGGFGSTGSGEMSKEYFLDKNLHTDPSTKIPEQDVKVGFIVIDGKGVLFGIVSGNSQKVLHRFCVELPVPHGHSSNTGLRFASFKMKKRREFIHRCAETATRFFISNEQPTITGLVLAGSENFKTELLESNTFDQRLQSIVIKVVDVSNGGDLGFKQAIELSQDVLQKGNFGKESNDENTVYVVRIENPLGSRSDIYNNLEECMAFLQKHPDAEYKEFLTMEDAKEFLNMRNFRSQKQNEQHKLFHIMNGMVEFM